MQFSLARVSRRRLSAASLVASAVFLGILLLVSFPLITLLIASLTPAGFFPFETTRLSLQHFAVVLGEMPGFIILRNTLLYALGSLAIALPLALFISWAVSRTDLPFRNTITALMMLPMAVPGLLNAFAWILLLNPNNGVFNIIFRNLLGQPGPGPLNIYTLGGMWFVTGTHMVTGAFLLLLPLWRSMNAELEESGLTSGANNVGVTRKITFPLLYPGVLAAAIYFFILGVEFFEVPLALGQTAGVPVLSFVIFLQAVPAVSGTPSYGLGAAFGIILLVLASGLIYLWRKATRLSARFATIGGKGARARRIALGRWKYVIMCLIGAHILVTVILPVAILGWAVLLPFYQPPSPEALKFVSLDNIAAFFREPGIRQAVINTGLLVFTAATLTTVFAFQVAWVSTRTQAKVRHLTDILSFAPVAIPGMVAGIAILLLTLRFLPPLYGTIFPIAIGITLRSLPFTTRIMSSAFIQIRGELEESAYVCGAPIHTVWRKITAPLVLPAIFNCWVWTATHAARELTIALMLLTPTSVVLSSLIWRYWERGETGMVAVLALLLIIVLMPSVFLFARKGVFERI